MQNCGAPVESARHGHPCVIASQRGLRSERSRPTVFLANMARQSLLMDYYLINIKHSEKFSHLCLTEDNATGIAGASIFY